MPLKEYKSVTTLKPLHDTIMGVTYRHEAGETLKLPPEVAKFLKDKGIVTY